MENLKMEKLRETLPPGLADAAVNIPGFGAIAQLFLNKLGFDVGNTMSLYLLLFGLWQGATFLYSRGRGYLLDHGTSAIRIDDDDDLYAQFISWISAQRMTELSRDLKASSRKPRARSDDSDDESDSESDDDDVLDEAGIFNYDKYTGTKPVYYEPNLGDDSFTHNGHYFQFKKDSQENKYAERIEYFLVIRCMGRSTQPVKDLINHVREWSSTKPNSMTDIYRAEPKHGGYWQCQTTRPSRPISTVTLDEAQKTKIVSDINEYLHPATARWYAARGIPHRRGYLFHGPPGTGKTSLSFAMAGIFGLSIYCASLSERDLGESDLASLFSQLPNRCIVLLEDIDSAGIRREKSADAGSDSDSDSDNEAEKPAKRLKEKPEVEKEEENVTDEKKDTISKFEQKESLRRRLTRVIRTPKPTKTDSETTTLVTRDDASEAATASSVKESSVKADPIVKVKSSSKAESVEEGSKSKISLAGLLNIIDGAASNEGRVLIMTTNYPEKLDSALIRPGRVDLQIKFTLATSDQIQEIFRRMYSNEADVKKPQNGKKKTSTPKPPNQATGIAVTRPNFVALPAERLTEMSKQFADQLPEATFSPAEIQGYLLMKKTDPEGALAGVTEWKAAMLEAKKKGKKVVEVK
ncbi:mitochondrial chaperone bcs1 [Ophiobolus disseminans]|uniref:Mitochondrial chaperone bcs1 n=1 Tax=Ophiobolus disseminans TaxID=1469910 RepID=A0A6A7A1H6_9PLEO|nr:mitochondrial chaperone bcs1 [Ophiobolus disseminans]